MTRKNDFNPEEWQLLSAMPWIAGVVVIEDERSALSRIEAAISVRS
jgi:hypothetical protein